MRTIYKDLGTIDYKEAWYYQEKLLSGIVSQKLSGMPPERRNNYVLFCEHPHVYTMGKSGKENNLLINDTLLGSINATYYKINRGGDITYHGPGQIVGYPVLDLDVLSIGVRSYIEKLENAIISTLDQYSIKADRLKGATGVWLDTKTPGKTRKICAIGVRVSRSVTMHGFAFNVNTDLNYFSYINPCGFIDKGVTSMQKELGKEVPVDDIKKVLLNNLVKELGLEL